MVAIRNKSGFEKWLEGKPQEWLQAVTARAALRALPLFDPRALPPKQTSLRLALWRANQISWAARKYPSLNVDADAAAAAAAATYTAAYDDVPAADAAAYAAYAAAAYTAYAGEAAYAAAAAYASDVVAAKDADVWSSISWDVDYLERSKGQEASPEVAARYLIEAPLWSRNGTPNDLASPGSVDESTPIFAERALGALRNNDRLTREGYGVWHDWYRSVLDGTPDGDSFFGEALDLRIAQQPEIWWRRKPKEVNREISEWVKESHNGRKERRHTIRQFILDYLEERSAPATLREILDAFQKSGLTVIAKSVRGQLSYLATEGRIRRVSKGTYAKAFDERPMSDWPTTLIEASDQPYGFSFEESEGQLKISSSGGETDVEAAGDRVTQKLFPEVQRRANAFRETGAKLDNQSGWRGIAQTSSRLGSVDTYLSHRIVAARVTTAR